jgi:hypothetical protein
MWNWLRANNTPRGREAILQILLHPHVRSYQIRSELGKRDWASLLPAVASTPIDELAQNVLATYILFGRRKHDPSELYADIVYCGRAASIPAGTKQGMRKRMIDHRDELRLARKRLALDSAVASGSKKPLWA